MSIGGNFLAGGGGRLVHLTFLAGRPRFLSAVIGTVKLKNKKRHAVFYLPDIKKNALGMDHNVDSDPDTGTETTSAST